MHPALCWFGGQDGKTVPLSYAAGKPLSWKNSANNRIQIYPKFFEYRHKKPHKHTAEYSPQNIVDRGSVKFQYFNRYIIMKVVRFRYEFWIIRESPSAIVRSNGNIRIPLPCQSSCLVCHGVCPKYADQHAGKQWNKGKEEKYCCCNSQSLLHSQAFLLLLIKLFHTGLNLLIRHLLYLLNRGMPRRQRDGSFVLTDNKNRPSCLFLPFFGRTVCALTFPLFPLWGSPASPPLGRAPPALSLRRRGRPA